jgi:dTDP-4-dehydrorhamnose reductase
MTAKPKYIISGASGKLGLRLTQQLPADSFITPKLDLAQVDALKSFDEYPDYPIFIHLAAKTHIDNCEKDRTRVKKSITWLLNVEGTKRVAEYCANTNKRLIYLSTESVFGKGKTSYTEHDNTNPSSWYGATKLAGEKEIQKHLSNYIILRSVLVFGGKPDLDLVCGLARAVASNNPVNIVGDQKISPTPIDYLVKAIANLVTAPSGTYHVAGKETTTPYKLALIIARQLNMQTSHIQPTTLKKYFGPHRARLRLKNAVLESDKYEKLTNHYPAPLEEAIKTYLVEWGFIHKL